MNAHVQRCIHLHCNGREDVIYRLVKGFDLSFETSEDVLCLGSCADVGMLPGWGGVGAAFSVFWLSLLPGTLQLLPVCPTNQEPSSGEGASRGWVNVKPCISSGRDGAKGPCFSFCMPLVPSYLLGFLSACEVIVCNTVLSTA